MGWGSGSGLADNLWNDLRRFIPEEKRKEAALKLIEHFENADCDTLEDCDELMRDSGKEELEKQELEREERETQRELERSGKKPG